MAAATPNLTNPRAALEALQRAAEPPSSLQESVTPVQPESVWRARLAMSGISVQYVKAEKTKKQRKAKVKTDGS